MQYDIIILGDTMKRKIIFISFIILFSILCIFIINMSSKYSEPQIKVYNSAKKITAYTGSFCDRTKCVDKLSIFEINYDDYLSVTPGEKIYIEDLDEDISEVKFFEENKDTKEFANINEEIEVNNEEKYIIAPNQNGTYIVLITAKYRNSNISYSFKVEISPKDQDA